MQIRSALAASAALLALAVATPAATIYVPDHHPSIQQAIAAASTGDTIIVRSGPPYVGDVDFLGKEINLRSEEGAAQTIIEGSGTASVVTIVGAGPLAVLEGFTIRGGNAFKGGAVHCRDSSPTIRSNVIAGNTATLGAGIFCENASPVITGNGIRDNAHDPLVSPGYGGGIYCQTGTPVVTGNAIANNSASYGGGIYLEGCLGEISGNRVEENRVDDVGLDSAYGGGICCVASSPLIARNLISGNGCYCPDRPGYPCGGGIYCSTGCDPTIEENRIADNRAMGIGAGYGGGFHCDRNSAPMVWRNVFEGNRSSHWGGGLSAADAEPIVVNNVFRLNSANSFGGGIVLSATSSSMRQIITHNTVVRNTAASASGLDCCGGSPELMNNIFWHNTGSQIVVTAGTAATVSHCDVEGGFPGTGNIDADPLFVDLLGGDFHITFGSPCREAGWNGAPGVADLDFEGDPRQVQSRVDIGADEFCTHLYHVGSVTPGMASHFRIVGLPGSSPVRLGVGSGVRSPPLPTAYGDLHLQQPFHSIAVGTVPSTGILTVNLVIPGGWKPGLRYPFQALVGPVGGSASRLTNLLLLPVE